MNLHKGRKLGSVREAPLARRDAITYPIYISFDEAQQEASDSIQARGQARTSSILNYGTSHNQ